MTCSTDGRVLGRLHCLGSFHSLLSTLWEACNLCVVCIVVGPYLVPLGVRSGPMEQDHPPPPLSFHALWGVGLQVLGRGSLVEVGTGFPSVPPLEASRFSARGPGSESRGRHVAGREWGAVSTAHVWSSLLHLGSRWFQVRQRF